MNKDSFEQARKYALERLKSELSPNLHYHGVAHTLDDVLPTVELLADKEGVTGDALTLLRTAALFHDIGFIQQPTFHEMLATRIVTAVLPEFGYNSREIETIRWIIMATIIPQSPTTLLEKIMADADLNVLGRKDFMVRNKALREELAHFGKIYTDVQWYTGQLKFIENHEFFTESARSLFDAQKAVNIAEMKKVLAALKE